MAHHHNGLDVREAFDRYRNLTGDTEAKLGKAGAYWQMKGRWRTFEAYGARAICELLDAYCEGWKDGAARSEEVYR